MSGVDNRKEIPFLSSFNITAILTAKDHESEPKIPFMQDISGFHVTFPGRKLNKNETQLQV